MKASLRRRFGVFRFFGSSTGNRKAIKETGGWREGTRKGGGEGIGRSSWGKEKGATEEGRERLPSVK